MLMQRQQCLGLFFYNELLHIFYRLRICDYKNATPHIERLDAAMKADLKKTQHLQQLTKEFDALNESLTRPELHHRERLALSEKQSRIQHQLASLTTLSSTSKGTLEPACFGNMKRTDGDKLELAPPPIDGEWLPKSAVYALVDLMMVVLSRPKGNFKDCGKRIQSGMDTIQGSVLISSSICLKCCLYSCCHTLIFLEMTLVILQTFNINFYLYLLILFFLLRGAFEAWNNRWCER